MPELFYWIWLSLKYSASHRSLTALLEHYGTPEKAYNAPKGEFASVPGISRRDAAVLEERDPERLLEVYTLCRDLGIEMIPLCGSSYPERLRHIYYPPPVLYVKGKLPKVDENPAIAVIGTRHCTDYGLKMGRSIATDIASRGAVVVSGLTKGIDAAAAAGALDCGGICIGVLGTAIDESESVLCGRAAESGAVISEYPPHTDSCRQFFRARNRICAGLSVGVVVVEAPEKSGTRLFVNEALEQGKDIYAVPGNADSPCSAGTNLMISQGAKPVMSGADVLCEYAAEYSSALHEPQAGKPAPIPEEKPAAPVPTGTIDIDDPSLKLSETQKIIIKAVNGRETSVDEVVANTGLPASKVLSMLTMLEIKGLVLKKPGNLISINPKHK